MRIKISYTDNLGKKHFEIIPLVDPVPKATIESRAIMHLKMLSDKRVAFPIQLHYAHAFEQYPDTAPNRWTKRKAVAHNNL